MIPARDTSRFVFSGHAIGAAAQFDRVGLNSSRTYMIPALGASVLPPTGGQSRSEVSDYYCEASDPTRKCLLSVRHIFTRAEGRIVGTRFETETEAVIESVTVAGLLHIDFVRVHVVAVRDGLQGVPKVTTTGNRIGTIQLGNTVTATVELDESPLMHCGRGSELAEFLQGRSEEDLHTARFTPQPNGTYTYTLVKNIDLFGPQDDVRKIEKDRNILYWKPFGFMHFGEVVVGAEDRQVTMVRLQMGSDAGGSGTVGDGQSNGHVITG